MTAWKEIVCFGRKYRVGKNLEVCFEYTPSKKSKLPGRAWRFLDRNGPRAKAVRALLEQREKEGEA